MRIENGELKMENYGRMVEWSKGRKDDWEWRIENGELKIVFGLKVVSFYI
jgi:hypothetical protein